MRNSNWREQKLDMTIDDFFKLFNLDLAGLIKDEEIPDTDEELRKYIQQKWSEVYGQNNV